MYDEIHDESISEVPPPPPRRSNLARRRGVALKIRSFLFYMTSYRVAPKILQFILQIVQIFVAHRIFPDSSLGFPKCSWSTGFHVILILSQFFSYLTVTLELSLAFNKVYEFLVMIFVMQYSSLMFIANEVGRKDGITHLLEHVPIYVLMMIVCVFQGFILLKIDLSQEKGFLIDRRIKLLKMANVSKEHTVTEPKPFKEENDDIPLEVLRSAALPSAASSIETLTSALQTGETKAMVHATEENDDSSLKNCDSCKTDQTDVDDPKSSQDSAKSSIEGNPFTEGLPDTEDQSLLISRASNEFIIVTQVEDGDHEAETGKGAEACKPMPTINLSNPTFLTTHMSLEVIQLNPGRSSTLVTSVIEDSVINTNSFF